MSLIAAVYSSGKVATGTHHGEAFSKLDPEEQEGDILSGFLDSETGHFQSDNEDFYVKEIVMIRHASCQDGDDPPLNRNGYEQVAKVTETLIQMDLDGYLGFTSPARRCTDTAFWINYWLHRKGHTPLEFSICDSICETSHTPVETLDHLPAKSLLVTHSDIINEIAYTAVGKKVQSYVVLPNASFTIVKNQQIICFGKRL
jgi:phosphohistidine phosphatase SixA